jgi:hypothetical protein
MTLIFFGCKGSYEEKVAGVEVPVPRGMRKADGQGLEVALLGFGGGQSSFRGQLDPQRVVDFYKKEMPSRGWQPSIGVTSKGGMLTYAKDNRTVIVTVGESNGETHVTITVGGTGR